MKILTATSNNLLNVSLLLLRLTVGVILFGAGASKVMGWFGGFGMEKTLGFFVQMGIPAWLGYVSCYAEFIGGFLLILGLLTRPVAFVITINMLVAFLETLPKGFFMGMAAYPFSIMISSIVLLLTGPLEYSLDALISRE